MSLGSRRDEKRLRDDGRNSSVVDAMASEVGPGLRGSIAVAIFLAHSQRGRRKSVHSFWGLF